MMISREEKKAEAIRRMKKLGYFKPSIEQFKRYDKVMLNEPPLGAHYYIDEDKKLVEKIQELEESNNLLVYAVIRSFLTDGTTNFTMDSLLYVEDYKEEWQYFDDDIKYNIAMAYTINWTWPDCSEFGSISIGKTSGAGLKRVC